MPALAMEGPRVQFLVHGSRVKWRALRFSDGHVAERGRPSVGCQGLPVYRLCAKDELPHVRLRSPLRIDIESYLAAPPRWNRRP
jgi:hypothetical protein